MRSPIKPWIDPAIWRDELDELRHILTEAGRTGPLRDEIVVLLAQVGRADRITTALLSASRAETGKSQMAHEDGDTSATLRYRQRGVAFMEAATIAKATR